MQDLNQTATVVIIGAGPAGTAAAISLAMRGVKSVIVEAGKFPRDRPGETFHPGSEAIFSLLGVRDQVERNCEIRPTGRFVQRCSEHSPQFDAFGSDINGAWKGYQVRRSNLDQVLLSRAQELGVCVMQPARAVDLTIDGRRISAVETNQGPIRADVVLDASGSNKFVSRFFSTRWHQHSRQLTARYGYVDRPQQRAGTSPNPFISYDECGWTWIAQIDLNSCAWVHLRFDGRDPGQDWIPLELRAFGNHLPSRGADVTWRIAEQLAGDNWFLLGDAAAILDPSSGHGALRAMMSGIHAAHLVGGTLSGSILSTDAALAYDSWLRAWFESDMHQLRKLADAPDVTAPHPPFEWSNLNLDAGRIELPGIQKPAAG